MSGYLPDLANWALRGGAGNNEENEGSNTTSDEQPEVPAQQLSEQEMRARRLASLARLETVAAQQQEPEAMDVDPPSSAAPVSTAMDVSSPPRKKAPQPPKPAPMPSTPRLETQQQKPKKKKEFHEGDSTRRLNRKKELLIKKVLNVTIAPSSDTACVAIELDSPANIGIHSIAELLATRLSLPVSALNTMPPQKPLIAYLAHAHRKAADEIRSLRPSSSKKADNKELQELLEEIGRQVVSYAASSLMEPDLFEQAKDGASQLSKALIQTTDPTTSITFGVSGEKSSFFYSLCEELHTQDNQTLERVVSHIVTTVSTQLARCDSIDSSGGDASPLGLVSALSSICCNKKVALAITQFPQFLLPTAGSAAANEQVRPTMPPGAGLLRMLAGNNTPYAYRKRSGPGLEKDTLLGLCLKISTPKNNPAFPSTNAFRQSPDSVEKATDNQRRQLRVYQETLNKLIMALIKGGHDARARVLQWFTDCLLVNTGATAMRPDESKVSSKALLLNTSIALLKLCERFVTDETKHKLIDPGFVSSAKHHGGIFATSGDDALPRLGESLVDPGAYNPKNDFVPTCFFLTARSLALGIVPMLSQHEDLLRHIRHRYWTINSRSPEEARSDPILNNLVSRERSNEVALFQEEMVTDTLRFCNLIARFLYQLPDETLRIMPEHFVNNVCDILMSIAEMKPKLLRGMDLRYVFQLLVKLLSPKYATMVRNYNLRAMLGDVLYEVYLPSTTDDRREIPTSVACDPLAGGQTYLLSDPLAQDTLAPSLLLLYGQVEHTGYQEKMSHRAKISSLLKYLWESSEHRRAFRAITENKESFIKFANGIINETNTLIATVMQKLPEIRSTQENMSNTLEWGRLTEEERSMMTSRLEENERDVKSALPLCNKTLQMFGYLNTDKDIRNLFLLEELCPRLVNMLLHVLKKLVGSKGLDLKVENPEKYEFRPKEMLRDLCAIFAIFSSAKDFQLECAKSGCDPDLLKTAVKTCQKINLLTGESMIAFESLPGLVEQASKRVAEDEELVADAPDEFLDEIMSTFMMDPVILPSGHYVDRPTITQHLLNDPIDPFNRKEMTIDDVKPATELKEKIDKWLDEKRTARRNASS